MNRSLVAFSFVTLLATAVGAAVLPACGDNVSVTGRPCPCGQGWMCCEETNVCIPGGGGSCPRAPRDAGAPDVLDAGADAEAVDPIVVASAQSARCLVTDGYYVYWQNANGLVVATPQRGGPLVTSTFQTPAANNARCDINVGGGNVGKKQLFTTAYELGKILRLDVQTTDTSNEPWTLGGGGALFGSFQGPSSLAVDESWVYVTEYEGGKVTKVQRIGGTPIVLAEGLVRPTAIFTDGFFLYFLERGPEDAANGGAVVRMTKEGEFLTRIATDLPKPLTMAYGGDRQRLFVSFADGRVLKMESDGKNVVTIAEGQTLPAAITAIGPFVYWATTNEILRAPSGAGDIEVVQRSSLPMALAVDHSEQRVWWATGDRVYSGKLP